METQLASSAIIMAGGKSSRMGQDKSLLLINGTPMIEHIYNQLAPHFQQILISSNDWQKYAFLNLDIIPDRKPDCGPLMGLASSLQASDHDLNAVVACDVPDINIFFLKTMLKQCSGYDAVIPNTDNYYEPLFAVYRKSTINSMNDVLAAGKFKIIEIFNHCSIKFIPFKNDGQYWNLNTWNDYLKYTRQNHQLAEPKVPLATKSKKLADMIQC